MEPLRGSFVNYHLMFFYGYGTATRFSPNHLITYSSKRYSIPISYQMSFGMPRLFTLSRSD